MISNYDSFEPIRKIKQEILLDPTYGKVQIDQKNADHLVPFHVGFSLMELNCAWSIHIDSVCKKVAPVCYCINQLRNILSEQILVMYYFAHFHSVATYGITVWGASTESCKKAVRFITGSRKRASCRDLFKKLRILTIPCTLLLNLLTYAKTELFTNTINSYHTYNTRNDKILEIPRHRMAKYQQCPKYLAIIAYNHLPNIIKNYPTKRFKIEVKTFLLNKCYYSLNEYYFDRL
ncbi:hypothetical protein NQ318_008129 [Aromia moschata]|uniref:RNA-directed DNA polymerase n=1 Tax=Aromia moschata TaxID=1265417 RepID=A0AAV8YPF0_9CUCU|nr:hypothetical protein NQ318_008129 [Aromia moschata]